jgi:predicted nucleic acid-binding protein
MNPPSYLLDLNFLIALADSSDTNHDDAEAIYRSLLDDFVQQQCLLVARADHLEVVANSDLFAAIDKLHVARQHRNAAAHLVERTGVGLDEAITLVLIKRCKIRKVATFDEALTRFDIDVITPRSIDSASVDPSSADPPSSSVGVDTPSMSSATKLGPETS